MEPGWSHGSPGRLEVRARRASAVHLYAKRGVLFEGRGLALVCDGRRPSSPEAEMVRPEAAPSHYTSQAQRLSQP